MRAALDVYKRTIVCASQPDDPRAGELRIQEIPNGEHAIRALVKRLGGTEGLVVSRAGQLTRTTHTSSDRLPDVSASTRPSSSSRSGSPRSRPDTGCADSVLPT
jgi:hypothetical protein